MFRSLTAVSGVLPLVLNVVTFGARRRVERAQRVENDGKIGRFIDEAAEGFLAAMEDGEFTIDEAGEIVGDIAQMAIDNMFGRLVQNDHVTETRTAGGKAVVDRTQLEARIARQAAKKAGERKQGLSAVLNTVGDVAQVAGMVNPQVAVLGKAAKAFANIARKKK